MTQSNIDPPNSRQPPHAFTLVELLVVIFIITILIAILLPVVHRFRRRPERRVRKANWQDWRARFSDTTAIALLIPAPLRSGKPW